MTCEHSSTISFEEIKALVGRKDPVVLEIGCNDGEDSRAFLSAFPQCKLFCFEPDPRAVKRFRTKIVDFRCKLFEMAIGSTNGSTLLRMSGGKPYPMPREWDLSSSIREPSGHLVKHPWCKFDETCNVSVMRLDTWSNLHPEINLIDFVWADVQGAEGDMIEGGMETLSRARYLYTEFYDTPLYEGQIDLRTIAERLTGFRLIGTYADYNALFKNEGLAPASDNGGEFKLNPRGFWENADARGHHFDPILCRAICDFLLAEQCTSILDLGCGPGVYTLELSKRGFLARGLDGNPNTPQVTAGQCEVADLSERLELGASDWVLSLEVGEHIPAEYEDVFLDNVARHGQRGVILSWAIEGQGGSGHVNCRNNGYIIAKMEARGFRRDGPAEKVLREHSKLSWFRDTIMVFRRS